MGVTVENLEIKVQSSSTDATDKVEKLSKSIEKASEKFKKFKDSINSAVSSVIKITEKIGKLVDKSNDYEETLNFFRVAMKDYYEDALDYATRVENALGIDSTQWMQYQATFQNMSEGFGIGAKNAEIMSRNLTQMGYDLASVFNLDFDKSMKKMESALSGQSRAVRDFGVDISQAALGELALSLGIEKNVQEMTQAEKAQLRYIQLFNTINNLGLSGDFQRTIESPANALRVLASNAQIAARELGNMFIPVLNKVLPYATALVKTIRWVASEIASFLGFKMTDIDYSGVTETSTGFTDVSEAANDATGAVQEFKNSVLGVDELNTLNDNSPSGAGGAGGGSGAGGLDFDLSGYDNTSWLDEGLSSKADKLFEKWKTNLEPTINWLRDNFDDILGLVLDIAGALLAWKISKTAVNAIKGIMDFAEAYPQLSKAMKITTGIVMAIVGIKWSWEAGQAIGRGDAGLMDMLKAALGPLATAAGGALIGSAISPGLGTGIGFAIGLTVGVVVELVSIITGSIEQAREDALNRFMETDEGEELNLVIETTAVIEAKNVELEADIRKITGKVDDSTLVDFALAKELINQIFDLNEEDNKTAAQIELIKEKIDILNGLGLEGVTLHFDDVTQSVVESKDAIIEATDALLQQYQVEALGDAYKEMLRIQTEAQVNLNSAIQNSSDATKAYQDAVDKAAKAQSDYNTANENFDSFLNGIQKQYGYSREGAIKFASTNKELKDTFAALTQERDQANQDWYDYSVGVDEAKKTQDDANAALEDARTNYNDATAAADNYGEALANIKSGTMDFTDAIADLGKQTGSGFAEGITDGSAVNTISTAVKMVYGPDGKFIDFVKAGLSIHSPSKATEELGVLTDKGFANGIENGTNEIQTKVTEMLRKVKQTFSDYDFSSGLNNMFNQILSKLDTFTYRFRSAVNTMLYNWRNAMNSVTINSSTGKMSYSSMASLSIPRFASGGYVDAGQLFIAREAGPELVGQMGSRTAVANNDQIVAGIASGVANANNEQNNLLREQNNLLRQLLSKDSTVQAVISTSSITEGLNRQNRRTGKTIVPVGAY